MHFSKLEEGPADLVAPELLQNNGFAKVKRIVDIAAPLNVGLPNVLDLISKRDASGGSDHPCAVRCEYCETALRFDIGTQVVLLVFEISFVEIGKLLEYGDPEIGKVVEVTPMSAP